MTGLYWLEGRGCFAETRMARKGKPLVLRLQLRWRDWNSSLIHGCQIMFLAMGDNLSDSRFYLFTVEKWPQQRW